MDRRTDSPAAVLKKLLNEQVMNENPVFVENPKAIPAPGKTAGKNSGAGGFDIEQYVKENFRKPEKEKPVEHYNDNRSRTNPKESPSTELNVSKKQLQQAVIWSEILGKPACKRHQRWR